MEFSYIEASLPDLSVSVRGTISQYFFFSFESHVLFLEIRLFFPFLRKGDNIVVGHYFFLFAFWAAMNLFRKPYVYSCIFWPMKLTG